MPILPRSVHNIPERGAWSPFDVEGETTAVVSCPECGHRASIEAYSIGPDGLVTPGL